MASVDAQWMPITGGHKVNIGASLGRALRARKGIAPPKRASNLPDRDFYSFRYNFKPESIDSDRPGSIEVKRTKESTSVAVERPSSQAREIHLFKGTEQPVKEYDCVLIYDEELDTFTLEKIDSFMNFTYDRKVQTSSSTTQRDTASPVPATLQAPDGDVELIKEIERDLVGLEDAEGEPDDDYGEIIAAVTSEKNNRRFEEEEEEDEELLLAASKAPVSALPPKSKPSRSIISHQQEPIHKPKSKPKDLSREKVETESRDIIDSELEEVLAFGVPTRTTKRRKLSPVAEKLSSATQLALPSASTSIILPSSRLPPKEDSDSEDDWDQVVGGDAHADNDTQEIDLDAFEQEMEQQLEGLDEDILAAVMTSEPTSAARRPMSLNQFAIGEQLSPDEDSTSSSDDSDDD